jgi:hypothetical protein
MDSDKPDKRQEIVAQLVELPIFLIGGSSPLGLIF